MDIQISTMNDKSNSHIAEMLIKGTNMGVIEGVKLKNQNPEANATTQKIAKVKIMLLSRPKATCICTWPFGLKVFIYLPIEFKQ